MFTFVFSIIIRIIIIDCDYLAQQHYSAMWIIGVNVHA
jgi:hypothetical protein